ncbi:uncharacterized [Tachysurus ichikawai]
MGRAELEEQSRAVRTSSCCLQDQRHDNPGFLACATTQGKNSEYPPSNMVMLGILLSRCKLVKNLTLVLIG